ncbi:MAG: hypothetical protein ACRCY4_03805 [Brevinema sp.]
MRYFFLLMLFPALIMGQEAQLSQFFNARYGSVDVARSVDVLQKACTSEEQQLALKGYLSNVQFRQDRKLSKANATAAKALFSEMEAFAKAKGVKELSPFFLNSLGDLTFTILGEYSLAQLIRMSKEARTYFETSLQKTPNNFLALVGIGSWYYNAPAIGGGSLKKAMQYFNDAEKSAGEPYQRYLIAIWKAQVHLKEKNKELYTQEMAKAEKVFATKGQFYEDVAALNAIGKPL